MPQKTISYLITLLTAFLLLSCSGEDSGHHTFFNSDFNYQPAPTSHKTGFDNIFNPRKMRVIGDFLTVDDFGSESKSLTTMMGHLTEVARNFSKKLKG